VYKAPGLFIWPKDHFSEHQQIANKLNQDVTIMLKIWPACQNSGRKIYEQYLKFQCQHKCFQNPGIPDTTTQKFGKNFKS